MERQRRPHSRRDRAGARSDGVHSTPVPGNWLACTRQAKDVKNGSASSSASLSWPSTLFTFLPTSIWDTCGTYSWASWQGYSLPTLRRGLYIGGLTRGDRWIYPSLGRLLYGRSESTTSTPQPSPATTSSRPTGTTAC